MQFQHPFTCIITGMTGCGKSTLVKGLIQHRLQTINPPPDRIIYAYGAYQEQLFSELSSYCQDIEFVDGLPYNLELDPLQNNMLVIDDLMGTCKDNQEISDLFTKGSHHLNLSVLLITHNLFQQGSVCRTISLNAHYIIPFKNPRDQQQISCLGRQAFPHNSQLLMEAYKEATERPFGYLVIDFKQTTPESVRLRTNILPSESPCIIFVPKK